MPAPAVYVLAIVGTVAAGIAFKEFVYDPHIAPKVEQWRDGIRARREARRMRRQQGGGGVLVPIGINTARKSNESDDDADEDGKGSVEMKSLLEWREGVDNATLRRRNNATVNASTQNEHILTSPSSVTLSPSLPSTNRFSLIDFSETATPTPPSFPSVDSTPSPSLNEAPSSSPSPSFNAHAQPSFYAYASPSLIPSLSLSHPIEPTEAEQGIDLVSPPSSRPDSPFSFEIENFSTVSGASVSSRGDPFEDVEGHDVGPTVRSREEAGTGTIRGTGRYLSREEVQRLIDEHTHTTATPVQTQFQTQTHTPVPRTSLTAQAQYLYPDTRINAAPSPAPSDSSYASAYAPSSSSLASALSSESYASIRDSPRNPFVRQENPSRTLFDADDDVFSIASSSSSSDESPRGRSERELGNGSRSGSGSRFSEIESDDESIRSGSGSGSGSWAGVRGSTRRW